jgi:hypothetical protein
MPHPAAEQITRAQPFAPSVSTRPSSGAPEPSAGGRAKPSPAAPALHREESAWRLARGSDAWSADRATPAIVLQADLALALGEYPRAIALLEAALREDDAWLLRLLLGIAYARSEPYPYDASEFQVCYLPGAERRAAAAPAGGAHLQ